MIEEKQSRRQFTRAFKAEAVALLLGGDKRAVEVAGSSWHSSIASIRDWELHISALSIFDRGQPAP